MWATIATYIISLISGYIYGLFFIYERKRVLLHPKSLAFIIFLSCIRLCLLLSTYYYLLITTQINFILILICFITGFWSLILQKKAISYGQF